MRCSFCADDAFYHREHEGVRLCRTCFAKSVEDKVRKTITRYSMLGPRDHIALALSGGKDSLTLLHLLAKLEKRYPRTRMTAITVDEGIAGYRDEAIEIARAECSRLGVNQVVTSFRELFGVTMDELSIESRKLFPCSYCGVFRRKAINRIAASVGADKIATAHNLDDEVQSVLLNLFHGDVNRIARFTPILQDPRKRFITRIKPLCEVPEREVVLYAYAKGLEFQATPCPHGNDALRGDIRTMLNRLEQKHQGIKHTIYGSAERLSEMVADRVPWADLRECTRCGDPTPNEICEACTMLGELAKSARALYEDLPHILVGDGGGSRS